MTSRIPFRAHPIWLRGLFALVLMLVPIQVRAEPPEPAYRVHYLYEGDSISWVPSDFAADVIAVALIEGPAPGQVTGDENLLTYTAPLDFFGRDSFIFELRDKRGNVLDSVAIELMVLPKVLPFSGYFSNRVVQGPALFNAERSKVVLCNQPTSAGMPLSCNHLTVVLPEQDVFIPLAWPTAGLDRLALFSPKQGKVLIFMPNGDRAQYVETVTLAGSQGSWPLIGDFFGDGSRRLVWVKPSGEVYFWAKAGATLLSGALPLLQPDSLTWPVIWPMEGETRQAIALSGGPASGLVWMALSPELDLFYGLESVRIGAIDYRRPFLYESLEADGNVLRQVSYLRQNGNSFELIRGLVASTSGHPTVIPVKFPDDPPVTGG